MTQRCIALVSGGLDSCVALAWIVEKFGKENITPINFSYGQRHSREIVCSEMVCSTLGVPEPITFNLTQPFTLIGGSSLTSGITSGNPSTEEVDRTPSSLPPSFVPGRNIVMLAIAASLGYTRKARNIVGGWNAVDYSGYPDCRPEFFANMIQALDDGLDSNVSIHAPLLMLTKTEIIQLGTELNAPMQYTWSCYAGGLTGPCGECDSCKIRIAGFKEAGIPDPALLNG